MEFYNKGFSTVLILDRSQPVAKVLQIRTKHFSRLKRYLLLIGVVVLSVASVIGFLYHRINEEHAEKQILLMKIVKLKSRLPEAHDMESARNYVQEIESKLADINKYLKKRGVKGFSTDAVGGSITDDDQNLSLTESYKWYNDHLSDINKSLIHIPIGFPASFIATSKFGYRNDPIISGKLEFHPGIDFRGHTGDKVKSTAAGRVIKAGRNGGYGNCICIQHNNGYQTLYGHLSKINVKVGQQVKAGQIIGAIGSTGRSTGSHLHYEIRKNGKPVNPANFLHLN